MIEVDGWRRDLIPQRQCRNARLQATRAAQKVARYGLGGADGNPVGIFLDGRADDVVNAAVVPEMDHLGALRLDEPAHDIDRRIVAIEQRRRGDETQRWPCLLAWGVWQFGRSGAHRSIPSHKLRQKLPPFRRLNLFKSIASGIAKILIQIKIMYRSR